LIIISNEIIELKPAQIVGYVVYVTARYEMFRLEALSR